jgi:CDP-diacylglycerol--glycerol-3-phosphate 3-phosphatidyltransferase
VPTTRLTGALPFPITIACLALVAGVGLAAGLRLVQRTRAALTAADAAAPCEPRTTARSGGEHPRLLRGGKATSAPL